MPEHQRLLRKILILTVGLIVAWGMIGFDVWGASTGPSGLFYSGLVLLAILGFFAAGWVFVYAESFTNSIVSEFPPFWLLIYVLVVAALIVLLPVAIAVLAVRYWIARRRFSQQNAENRAGG